jgi:hypothetical protein
MHNSIVNATSFHQDKYALVLVSETDFRGPRDLHLYPGPHKKGYLDFSNFWKPGRTIEEASLNVRPQAIERALSFKCKLNSTVNIDSRIHNSRQQCMGV